MNAQNVNNTPKITKESKNKIRVEFERVPLKERLKLKYFNLHFLKTFVFAIFRYVLLIGISYIILFPFFSKISGSFMGVNDFVDTTVRLIPKDFTFNTYKAIFLENNYMEAFFNTLSLSLISSLIQTFICALIAYGFAKFKFKGNKVLFGLVLLTMIVPHSTLRFSLDTAFQSMEDTFWPWVILSLTGLAFKNGLYIFLLRQFFRGVPDELEESAYIDGSGTFKTFVQIILPISVPMLITVFLFAFSWQWTDNFYVDMFFSSTSKTVLMPDLLVVPLSIAQPPSYAGKTLYDSAVVNTAGIMIIAPLIVMYIFCQRFLVQGIERSGITG